MDDGTFYIRRGETLVLKLQDRRVFVLSYFSDGDMVVRADDGLRTAVLRRVVDRPRREALRFSYAEVAAALGWPAEYAYRANAASAPTEPRPSRRYDLDTDE